MKSDNHNGAVTEKRGALVLSSFTFIYAIKQSKSWKWVGRTRHSLSPNEFVLEARSLREMASLSEVSVGGATL